VLFYAYMPMLLCDCQSFIKESYLLTCIQIQQFCELREPITYPQPNFSAIKQFADGSYCDSNTSNAPTWIWLDFTAYGQTPTILGWVIDNSSKTFLEIF